MIPKNFDFIKSMKVGTTLKHKQTILRIALMSLLARWPDAKEVIDKAIKDPKYAELAGKACDKAAKAQAYHIRLQSIIDHNKTSKSSPFPSETPAKTK
jgi:hypothetical protein